MVPAIIVLVAVFVTSVFENPMVHAVKDYVLGAVGMCSFLHTFSPPWDWEPEYVKVGLADFPVLRKVWRFVFSNRYYKLYVYTIGYVAVNFRSTVWKSISIGNPSSVNYAGNNGKNHSQDQLKP